MKPRHISVEQLSLLLTLLRSSTTPLAEVGEKLKRTLISTGAAFQTVLALRLLYEDNSTIASTVSSQNETLIALYLISVLADQESSALPAKVLFCNMLQSLEYMCKTDCKRQELGRHRLTKDAAGDKRITATEAAASDALRIRLILKAFAFHCLLHTAPVDRSAQEILSVLREAAERSLDEIAARAAIPLKEAVLELQRCSELREGISLGFPSSRCVPAADGEFMKPPTLHVPTAPLHYRVPPTELRTLCSPSLSSVVAFDAVQHPSLWKETKDLLVQASQKTLTATQQQLLLQDMAQGNVSRCVGLTPELFLGICRRTPQVAAPLIQLIPQSAASQCLRTVVDRKEIDPATVNAVVVQASAKIEPPLLSQYVSTALSRIDENGSSASEVSTGLALTLQQLCLRGPHKLSSSDKSRLSRRFLDPRGDGGALWTELLSSNPQQQSTAAT